jgi:cytochrome c peroxidase
MRTIIQLLLLLLVLFGPALARAGDDEGGGEEADPPEVAIGERLFLETRFSQFFQAHSGGDANAALAQGDPVMDTLQTLLGPIPGPFAGGGMNCRACHLVDDAKDIPGGGNRSYADFARRSPIPERGDGRTMTPRDSPPLVNSTLARGIPFFLHFDGEFPSTAALAEGTVTGRNFGWLPSEHAQAVTHIASVIRGDDGTGGLAAGAGGSYRRVLAGTDPTISKDFRLPRRFRIDVDRASDEQILRAVSRLIAAYVESLEFENSSPYDRFLEKNGLPEEPREFESPTDYVKRLKFLLAEHGDPEMVTDADGAFQLHRQPFVFGATELTGLQIFLDRTRGNCVACHPPPHFTDFRFHNTGVAQEDYDAMHGAGSFAALDILDLAARRADPDAFLPATPLHPAALEPFRSVPAADAPERTDLGVWNLMLNPDYPKRAYQHHLERMVCASQGPLGRCRRSPDVLLSASMGLFKTPGLRDLGQSQPYLHTGSKDTLEDVVRFYVTVSGLAQTGRLRNGAPELSAMHITDSDVTPLAAFLRALNEDYE